MISKPAVPSDINSVLSFVTESAASLAVVTELSLGVPIETVSPKTKMKSTVSVASGASEKTMFVLLILKAVEGACITPEIEHNTLFSEPGATAADVVDFILVLGETVSIGTPTDNTVTTAKLAADSVTKDKTEFISDGTAGLEIKGDGSSVDGYIQLNCHVNTHGVKIKAPPHSAGASYTLILPNNTGTNGQVLSTNGSGTLSFIDAVETKPVSYTHLTLPTKNEV